jgi:hypothetical protein
MLTKYEIVTETIHIIITSSDASGNCECISWVKLIYSSKSKPTKKNAGNKNVDV